jgi:hypothetical protein
MKHLAMVAFRGLNDEAHLVNLIGFLNRHREGREVPVVVLDREGSIGSSLYGKMMDFVSRNPEAFHLVAVRASDRAVRQPRVYDRMRDELAQSLFTWIRDGGAILEDHRLQTELHTLEWSQHANGRLKVTPKDVIRKTIGRSPDRYDSLALACWEPLAIKVAEEAPSALDQYVRDYEPVPTMDPYAGVNIWHSR